MDWHDVEHVNREQLLYRSLELDPAVAENNPRVRSDLDRRSIRYLFLQSPLILIE